MIPKTQGKVIDVGWPLNTVCLFDEDFELEASDELRRIIKDPHWCKPGYRNDSMVNTCIYAHWCKADVFEILEDALHYKRIDREDFDAAYEAAERIMPYVDDWCRNGYDRSLLYTV